MSSVVSKLVVAPLPAISLMKYKTETYFPQFLSLIFCLVWFIKDKLQRISQLGVNED
jgi:hypothetical protein